jgi:hypothetical protein
MYTFRVCMVALAISVMPILGAATCIVAIVTPGDITIAADSLETYTAGPSKKVCKVFQSSSGCAFTMAGIARNDKRGFNMPEIGERSCSLPGDLASKVSHFEIFATPALQDEVAWERDYDQRLPDQRGGVLAVCLFAAYEHGSPKLQIVKYVLAPSGAISVDRQAITARPDRVYVRIFCKDAEKLSQQARGIFRTDPSGLARNLLLSSTNRSQDGVGPGVRNEIAIVRISKRGSEWVELGGCNSSQSRATNSDRDAPSVRHAIMRDIESH